VVASFGCSSILSKSIESPLAWTSTDIKKEDYFFELSRQACVEIQRLLKSLQNNPLPSVDDLHSHDLLVCRELMASIKNVLDKGLGFAILDRLPLDSISIEEAEKALFILSSLIGRPVPQNRKGLMFWDVQDLGLKPLAGSGVRPSQSNIALDLHNDFVSNPVFPPYIGLLALQVAKEGGESLFASFYTIHNHLLQYYPHILERLYQPFYFDRMGEHGDEEPTSYQSIFKYQNGHLTSRLDIHLIKRGYEMRAKSMDEAAIIALEALKNISVNQSLCFQEAMEPGQVQFVNNNVVAHGRDKYKDGPQIPRHYKRIWFTHLPDDAKPSFALL